MLSVLVPGTLTTVQDAGRVGWARYGIPPSGPMDHAAFAAANLLVGNPTGAAGLEITLEGPTLEVGRDCVVAVCGASFDLTVGRRPAPMWHAIYLRRGEALRFGQRHGGTRAYLSVDGGVAVAPYLGSRATYLPGGFGGLEGRALRAGDRLPTGGPLYRRPIQRAGVSWPPPSTASMSSDVDLRVVLGPQDDAFAAESIRSFLSQSFTVTAACDRMGVRLRGPAAIHSPRGGIVSDGIVNGSIQVPADGQPIVMMVDHQTTGGYPKIATVIQADLPALAQRLPGDKIRFVQVSVLEARTAYQAYTRMLRAWQRTHSCPH